MNAFKQFRPYLKPHRALFFGGGLLMMAEAAGEILQPYLLSHMINAGIPNRDYPTIVRMGIGMILTAAMMMLAQVIGTKLCVRGSMRFGRDVRKAMFKRLQHFSFSTIDRYSEPSLVTRLTNDVTLIQNMTLNALRTGLKAPILLILGCIMAFRMNQSLSVVLIVAMPLLALTVVGMSLVSFPRFDVMQQGLDRINAAVQENLLNVRVVKSFARGNYETKRFTEANEQLKRRGTRAYMLSVSITPIISLIMNAAIVLILWMGGFKVLGGELSIGTLSVFATYVLEILAALTLLGLLIVESTRAVASFRRISELLGEQTEPAGTGEAGEIAQGKVELRHVSFWYYKERPAPVLDDISLTVEPGQTFGVIGTTGSGKSTLASLIPRLYEPQEGSILIDGRDIRAYSREALRRGIDVVPQKNILFIGTVEDNLRWGDPEADVAAVREAARLSCADGFVTGMDQGYQTAVKQGGINLSGGQKQRLCIARALVRHPKIVILDDSTASVDMNTERTILENLRSMGGGSTIILITQKISSLHYCDRIAVLDRGKLVGLGTHETLLKTSKAYAEIYASQADRGAAS